MSGKLDKVKKKIETGAEMTEAEAKKVGGDIEKAGIRTGAEVKQAGKKSACHVNFPTLHL